MSNIFKTIPTFFIFHPELVEGAFFITMRVWLSKTLPKTSTNDS